MKEEFLHVGTPAEIAAIINHLEDKISLLEARVKFYKECLMDTNYLPENGDIRIIYTDEQVEALKSLGINL